MHYNHHELKLNFLGLSEKESDYKSARFVVLPVPFELTTTYRKGTCDGPRTIIAASQEVELFDDDLNTEPYLAGVHTLDELDVVGLSSESMFDSIYEAGRQMIADNKIICMLGGEHSISTGMVKAYKNQYPNISVLQLDAHSDLRDSYQDNKHSHACAMRRIRELVDITVGVGIRNISKSESEFIKSENITLFKACDMDSSDDWMENAIDLLSDDVYLTIDCDYFDPSIMPAVGTPEPGGGLWYPTLEFLEKVIEKKNILGFDIVELSPLPVNNASEFTAAKLIYKIIGLINRKMG
jgi:N1-aminopropylagmatine ureohydrolase